MSRSYKEYPTRPGGKGYMPPGARWVGGKLIVPYQKPQAQIPGTLGHAADLDEIPKELEDIVKRRKP